MKNSRNPSRGRGRAPAQPSQLGCARELLREVLGFAQASDAVVSRYFRAHPKLGQRDRHLLAETVYQIVRNLRLYRQLAQGGPGAEELKLLALGWQGDNSSLQSVFAADLLAWREAALAVDRDALPFAVRNSLPDWLAQALQQRGDLDAQQLEALGHSMLQPAPLDLRVNLLKSTRDTAQAALQAAGIASLPTPYSPWGLRVAGKPALARTEVFSSGAVEVQDEGSQLLALLLAPRRGEMVADFCAGAGGKTLALGAMMRSSGRLYAFDVSQRRLDKLGPRLARSGLSNVYPVAIVHERDDRVQRLAGKLDRVLVDAPCSGTGTLRRNPDLKWRMSPTEIARLGLQQAAILDAASALLKPGGRLVYATCSLLPAENRAQVDAFLQRHPDFSLLPVADVLRQQQVELPGAADMLELMPQRHATDGFFAAVLQRGR